MIPVEMENCDDVENTCLSDNTSFYVQCGPEKFLVSSMFYLKRHCLREEWRFSVVLDQPILKIKITFINSAN